MLVPKPQTLNHVESAAIPLPALSAWQALFDHGDLQRGERVLIHGAAGAVGGFGVQLARDRGAHVIATASTSNLDAVRDLGADEVIDHTVNRFEDVLDPVDLVFDTVGGDLLGRSLSVLRPGGRLVSVAEEPPTERAAELGVTASYFVVEGNREQLVHIASLADQGTLTPRVAATFALADAGTAFARSLDGSVRGKIVLRVNDES